MRLLFLRLVFGLSAITGMGASLEAAPGWPEIGRTQRPWTYWWWMASAVDEANITRELTRYRDAGLGGVHIIPIYGARGFESNYISYLSPRWMQMLDYTVREARRLGLGVDMTTGSGWCFGGPQVADAEANAAVISRQFEVAAGAPVPGTFSAATNHAVMAFGPHGEKVDLLQHLKPDGTVNWTAPSGPWRVFAISQRPAAQKVKRAGPGGEGWMLNLFYAQAMTNFLAWMDSGFANYTGAMPRAQYHDSYEYKSEWAPDFFSSFERRRGYRLQDELPALFGTNNLERSARVKCDYRETISELMSEVTLPLWVKWARDKGCITRNEAHGSPGNWLDLYAVADIPETEMFHHDRNRLISKFASSAAHVMGRQFCASETGTWLEEHFTETLADMKFLLDDLFLSGVNHVFYHGACYSPDEAGWPGWLFYASYEMNPRNSVWRDARALNEYVARCQSILQAGQPDNDVLVYWPIHDRWSDLNGLVQTFTIHNREWFEQQPISKTAAWLWKRGYQFDYISDKQLRMAKVARGKVEVRGGDYRVVLVPPTIHMPVETLAQLRALAEAGATVIFESALPKDVPGLGQLENRRVQFQGELQALQRFTQARRAGGGSILVGTLDATLAASGASRERLADQDGLMCIRRKLEDGRAYFIANRGTNAFDGWLPLAVNARSVRILDPLTGETGLAETRRNGSETEVYLQLAAGQSVLLRTSPRWALGSGWVYHRAGGAAIPLQGTWKIRFTEGGPELPRPAEMRDLVSWTQLGDTNAQRFAGGAVYSLTFDAPGGKEFLLDLGSVCQSARVRLNGKHLRTLLTPPFRLAVSNLKRRDNVLEVEVTNVSANRIRDLDRRGVNWKNFRDINFVNIDYRPFDASNWPLTDSGLLGPVTLTPVVKQVP